MKPDRMDAYQRCRERTLALYGDELDEIARMDGFIGGSSSS